MQEWISFDMWDVMCILCAMVVTLLITVKFPQILSRISEKEVSSPNTKYFPDTCDTVKQRKSLPSMCHTPQLQENSEKGDDCVLEKEKEKDIRQRNDWPGDRRLGHDTSGGNVVPNSSNVVKGDSINSNDASIANTQSVSESYFAHECSEPHGDLKNTSSPTRSRFADNEHCIEELANRSVPHCTSTRPTAGDEELVNRSVPHCTHCTSTRPITTDGGVLTRDDGSPAYVSTSLTKTATLSSAFPAISRSNLCLPCATENPNFPNNVYLRSKSLPETSSDQSSIEHGPVERMVKKNFTEEFPSQTLIVSNTPPKRESPSDNLSDDSQSLLVSTLKQIESDNVSDMFEVNNNLIETSNSIIGGSTPLKLCGVRPIPTTQVINDGQVTMSCRLSQSELPSWADEENMNCDHPDHSRPTSDILSLSHPISSRSVTAACNQHRPDSDILSLSHPLSSRSATTQHLFSSTLQSGVERLVKASQGSKHDKKWRSNSKYRFQTCGGDDIVQPHQLEDHKSYDQNLSIPLSSSSSSTLPPSSSHFSRKDVSTTPQSLPLSSKDQHENSSHYVDRKTFLTSSVSLNSSSTAISQCETDNLQSSRLYHRSMSSPQKPSKELYDGEISGSNFATSWQLEKTLCVKDSPRTFVAGRYLSDECVDAESYETAENSCSEADVQKDGRPARKERPKSDIVDHRHIREEEKVDCMSSSNSLSNLETESVDEPNRSIPLRDHQLYDTRPNTVTITTQATTTMTTASSSMTVQDSFEGASSTYLTASLSAPVCSSLLSCRDSRTPTQIRRLSAPHPTTLRINKSPLVSVMPTTPESASSSPVSPEVPTTQSNIDDALTPSETDTMLLGEAAALPTLETSNLTSSVCRSRPFGNWSLTGAYSMPEDLDKLTQIARSVTRLGPGSRTRPRPYSSAIAEHKESSPSDDDDLTYPFTCSGMYEEDDTRSSQSSQLSLSALNQIVRLKLATYVEAMWDHVTMDTEELGFRAGDLIQVTDCRDRYWWFGILKDAKGWFPATFVRIRLDQDFRDSETSLVDSLQTHSITLDTPDYHIGSESGTNVDDAVHPHSSPHGKTCVNNESGRANVVREIVNAEREYVKHLKDVVEGYVKQARKRPEMFPGKKVDTIFSNIEDIYKFATELLASLEKSINPEKPHASQIGKCFLVCMNQFEIYSDYCNNHPAACEELRELYRNKRYKHFFEACRLLQDMIEIPLEGFLLTPVQKICKYHLQLAELLNFTPPSHPDHSDTSAALDAMKRIAALINERKRKMESVEKLAAWQLSVDDWEGAGILERSSELIFSGELNKVNHAGWSQERYFFLFDHQLIYCKKDLLKKSTFVYKGRIFMEACKLFNVSDGREPQYNVSVRNALKLFDVSREKWFLLIAKTFTAKQRWLKAFQEERDRVKEDAENNINIPDDVKQSVVANARRKAIYTKPKGLGKLNRSISQQSFKTERDYFDTLASLPRNSSSKNLSKVKLKDDDEQVKDNKGNPTKSRKISRFFLGKGKS